MPPNAAPRQAPAIVPITGIGISPVPKKPPKIDPMIASTAPRRLPPSFRVPLAEAAVS
jgi:hypothetical protein